MTSEIKYHGQLAIIMGRT